MTATSRVGKRGRVGGFVYLMRRADGLWKLGSSVNVLDRSLALRSHYGQPVQIRTTWLMGNIAAQGVERVAHRLLSPYRINGFNHREVYRASRRQMVDAVETAMETVERLLPNGLYEAMPQCASPAAEAPAGAAKPKAVAKDKPYQRQGHGPFDWPEIKAAIEAFNADPPAAFNPEIQYRLGFIRPIPEASAEDQRRWMMQQGVHPIDQWVHDLHGALACEHSVMRIEEGDLFYLWSEAVLVAPYTIADIEEKGATVVLRDR